MFGIGTYMIIVGGTNAWNPVGWGFFIAGAIMSVASITLSFYKAIGKAISDDYKMNQQRKAVDENLRKICDNIEDKINEAITNEIIDKNLKPFVENLQDALKSSVENIKEASEFFGELRENEVLPLAEQIKIEGGL